MPKKNKPNIKPLAFDRDAVWDEGGYSTHPAWLAASDLNPTDERVWVKLWELYKMNGWIRIRRRNLAELVRLNVKTLDLSLERLREAKLITSRETGRASIITMALEHPFYALKLSRKEEAGSQKTGTQLPRKRVGRVSVFSKATETQTCETQKEETPSSETEAGSPSACSLTAEEVPASLISDDDTTDSPLTGGFPAVTNSSPSELRSQLDDRPTDPPDSAPPPERQDAPGNGERGAGQGRATPEGEPQAITDAKAVLELLPEPKPPLSRVVQLLRDSAHVVADVLLCLAHWNTDPQGIIKRLGSNKAKSVDLGVITRKDWRWFSDPLLAEARKAKAQAAEWQERDRQDAEREARHAEEQRQLEEKRAADQRRIEEDKARKLAALPSSPEADTARRLAKIYCQHGGDFTEVEKGGAQPWLAMAKAGASPERFEAKVESWQFNNRGCRLPAIDALQTWSWDDRPAAPASVVAQDDFAERFVQQARANGEAWAIKLEAERAAA